ncbi:MAG: XRE family transcriptional regulator [Myxococcota bacterium]
MPRSHPTEAPVADRLDALSDALAQNLRAVREVRGLTQQQLADLCGVPRSTVAHIESGGTNPTLGVLARLAGALHLSLEELLAPPRARCQLFPRGSLPEEVSRRGGAVRLAKLLPNPVPGMSIDRLELASGATLAGSPHAPGTHEFLYCERGRLDLWVAGEHFALSQGDVAAFTGDQRHSYRNPGRGTAVGFSVVCLAPLEAG